MPAGNFTNYNKTNCKDKHFGSQNINKNTRKLEKVVVRLYYTVIVKPVSYS